MTKELLPLLQLSLLLHKRRQLQQPRLQQLSHRQPLLLLWRNLNVSLSIFIQFLNVIEGAPVKDKSNKCTSYKKFCKNPKYKAKLASQCPATCGVCVKSKPEAKTPSAAGTGPVCKDNVPAQCPKMKRYCGSARYEKVLKQKCSKTCGFCTSDGSEPTSAPAASSQGKK